MTRRLIVAPHADDEALGCGGLLAKYPDECQVAVVSAWTPAREKAMWRAKEILGYDTVCSFGFEDGAIAQAMREVVAVLDELMHDVRPDELYLPFPSMHQDHVAVYEAGVRSARLSMSDGHWFPPTVLVYDVAVYDVNLYPTDLRWNVFEPLDGEHVAKKVDACHAYEEERPGGPHPMNGVWAMAAAVGQSRKVELAEQYALIRQVRH